MQLENTRMQYIRLYILVTILSFLLCPNVWSQVSQRSITLDEVVGTLSLESTSAKIERLNFQNDLLQFENYKKSFLPSFSFSANPVNSLQYSVDTYNYVNSPLLSTRMNSLEFMLQTVGLDYFYTPVAVLPRTPVYIGEGDSKKVHLYNIVYPQKYLGDVIYIKDSKAMRVFNMDIPVAKKYNALELKFHE